MRGGIDSAHPGVEAFQGARFERVDVALERALIDALDAASEESR